MFRFPGTRPDVDLLTLGWLRLAGAALFFAALLVYACEVSSGRKQCAQTCAARGAADFIYVPGDSRSAREAECICGDPSPAAPVGS